MERPPGRVRVRLVVPRRGAGATSLPFGVVNAPGQRYHPAIIAQAAASLSEMFPERLWIALGTGEASNEHITGERLAGQGRAQRAAARVRGHHARAVRRRGGLARRARHRRSRTPVDASRSRLRTCSCAAVSEKTAALGRRVGGRVRDGERAGRAPAADARRVRARRLPARAAGARLLGADRRGGAARSRYDQWRTNVFDPPVCWDLDTPEAFDAAAQLVHPDGLEAQGA